MSFLFDNLLITETKIFRARIYLFTLHLIVLVPAFQNVRAVVKRVRPLSACVEILNRILIFYDVKKSSKMLILNALLLAGLVNTFVYRIVLESTKTT